jgi:pimeloyl-ACP methyl ester carboxylesterase
MHVRIFSGATSFLLIAALLATATGQAASPTAEKDAIVFGYQLHYRETGQGPPVILLHGLGGDGSRWTSTTAALADDFRVIALDQIGFGESDKPLVSYNHGLLAEFLVEFMRTIDVPKASIVGHSMGAFVGTYVAVHHSDKLDRLVLVDGGSLEQPPRPAHLVRIQNGTTLAETREYFELMFRDKTRVTDQLVRDNYMRRLRASYTITRMQESRANRIGFVSKEQAATIKAPTLVLWGKHDELLPVGDGELLKRVIPNSRLVVLQKSGHIPQVEQPGEFNKSLHDFLAAKSIDAANSAPR